MRWVQTRAADGVVAYGGRSSCRHAVVCGRDGARAMDRTAPDASVLESARWTRSSHLVAMERRVDRSIQVRACIRKREGWCQSDDVVDHIGWALGLGRVKRA